MRQTSFAVSIATIVAAEIDPAFVPPKVLTDIRNETVVFPAGSDVK
jgi:hypothetical protein